MVILDALVEKVGFPLIERMDSTAEFGRSTRA
jgi:hypothetical protein